MSRLWWLRVRQYLRDSLWVVPALMVAGAVWLSDTLLSIDRTQADQTTGLFGLDPSAATAVLTTVAAGMLTLTGLVFSLVMIAVQFGSSQYSPRLTRLLLRSALMRITFGLFVATFTFALLHVLAVHPSRQPDFVPNVSVVVAILLVLVSVAGLLGLLDRFTAVLRASGLLGKVGRHGRRVAMRAHPPGAALTRPDWPDGPGGRPDQVIDHRGRPGVVVALDLPRLVRLARRAGGTVTVVPAIGDFVPAGAHLAHVRAPRRVRARALRSAVLLGGERGYDEDPKLPIRLLVDVAIRALSPGINDPTTAVQALDQIHSVLRTLVARQLGQSTVRDRQGTVRVRHRVPTWEAYLTLAVTEIRQYGASSVQVARRLRAMLDDLAAVAPPACRPALAREVDLLDETVDHDFAEPHDRALARHADHQGIG